MTNPPEIDSVKLVFSGNDFFQTLENAIEKATEIIHLQTYIFEEDETGMHIVDLLAKAVQRNVTVYILADAYGSKGLSIPFIKKIQDAGIHFRFFSPLFSKESIYAGRRLHHKIVVIDKYTGIVGGINIGDRYRGNQQEPAWLDYAVLMEGNVCLSLHALCEELYTKKKSRRIRFKRPKKQKETEISAVRFNRNDWIKGKNEIYKSCIRSIKGSKESIVIICSYFLPGYNYRKALKDAKKRGVNIKVILAGKSDVPLLFYAEKYLYHFLARHEIEIFEWPNSVMHAKAIAVDRYWTTIGSYNMNYLSHYRSIELNVELNDPQFSTVFLDHINTIIINDCIPIRPETILHSQSLLIRFRNGMMYFLYRLIMKLFLPYKNLKKR